MELNRNYEIPKNDYSYIEKRHKLLLKEQVTENVQRKFPWMDQHLSKIVIQEEYRNTLEMVNKDHYLADLREELDALL
jgi:hypothetical protein